MRYYRYYSMSVLMMRVVGTIIFLVGFALSPLILIGLYRMIVNYPMILPKESFVLFGVIIFFMFLGIILSNFFPNLAVDDKGLYVQFYFKWLFVPWKNVSSFHQSFISTLGPSSRKIYFVLVKDKLTVVHWLISFNQLGGWGPGFLISQNISDFQELNSTIRKHLGT